MEENEERGKIREEQRSKYCCFIQSGKEAKMLVAHAMGIRKVAGGQGGRGSDWGPRYNSNACPY